MRQSAIALILSTADASGEAYTLDIFFNDKHDYLLGVKFLKFHYIQSENLLEVEDRRGKHLYIDGDLIQSMRVNC